MQNQYLALDATEVASIAPLSKPVVFPKSITGSDTQFVNAVFGENEGSYSFPAIAQFNNGEVTRLFDLLNNRVITLHPVPSTNLRAVVLPPEDNTYGFDQALPAGIS